MLLFLRILISSLYRFDFNEHSRTCRSIVVRPRFSQSQTWSVNRWSLIRAVLQEGGVLYTKPAIWSSAVQQERKDSVHSALRNVAADFAYEVKCHRCDYSTEHSIAGSLTAGSLKACSALARNNYESEWNQCGILLDSRWPSCSVPILPFKTQVSVDLHR